MKPVDLRRIVRFAFQAACLEEVEAFLRKQGKNEREGLVLVSGSLAKDSAIVVDRVHVPEQDASAFHVQVMPNAMLRIHHELLGQERLLVGQIHTHPGEAFHSKVDREDTTLTQPGTFSIVVPDFAARGLKGWPECAVYRRLAEGWSRPLDADAMQDLFPEALNG